MKLISFASGLCLLMGLMACTNRGEHLKALYNQYFAPDTFRLLTVLDELSANSDGQLAQLKNGLQLLRLHENQAAFDNIWEYLYHNPGDRRVEFLAAQSLMALNRQGEASAILEPLADAPDFVWRDDAHWFLALCFLQKEENEPKARSRLLRVSSDPSSPYQKNAAALLKEMD